MKAALCLLGLGLLTAPLWSQAPASVQTEVRLWSEATSYNQIFQDRGYLTRSLISQAVPLVNLGSETLWQWPNGSQVGFGLNQVWLGAGQTANFDQTEVQTETRIQSLTVFAGQDWDWVAYSLGLGWLFHLENRPAGAYLQPDGTSQSRPGGWTWVRGRSFTMMIGSLRLLPVQQLHFLIRMGREDYQPVDSLLEVLAIWPVTPTDSLQINASLPTIPSYFMTSEFMLRSNQRLSLGYAHRFGPLEVGLRGNVLIRPSHQLQDGDIPLLARLGVGATVKLTF